MIFYNLSEEEFADEKFIEELFLGGASEEDLNRESNEESLK